MLVSVVVPPRALENTLRSCGAWAQWDLPGPGMEPVSPALAGRFFPTEAPGKPLLRILDQVAVSGCGLLSRGGCLHSPQILRGCCLCGDSSRKNPC